MKILIVCQYYYPENFVITNIAEEFIKMGHEVTLLTGKPNYGYGKILKEYKNVSFEEINGVKVNRVNIHPRKNTRGSVIRNYLSFYNQSRRWIRKHKSLSFDFVYSMSLSPVTILGAGNLFKKYHPKAKHIVHCLDLWPESVVATGAVKRNSLTFKFLLNWSKKLYSGADKILIGTPSFEDYFRNVLNISKPIEYVPQPSMIEGSKIEEFEYDKTKFNLLYCGNIGHMQNVPLLISLMNKLKGTKIMFHIIGMGPFSHEIEKAIIENDLTENVLYYGPLNIYKAAKYIVGADCLYFSLKENGPVGKTIPNRLITALSLKKPLIFAGYGDSAELIKNADCGFVVDENPDLIIDLIQNSSKTMLDNKGKNGLTYYEKNNSLSFVCNAIVKSI